uniref:DUF6824 domain-containing protein n=1 Tax=Odontella aurita TaxID=265563 RepID=A0A7S4HKF7_9STRA|mmetsp:Transcript_11445/g.33736  ORF Transcript_11445/g.33736 Transcript_11445/m.33736 type:complete len:297 (+) Transcript_11445:343-1233(+)|eukprot:CAMPEP_0113532674 /NCGR_PEP_ID=MMETSP0015_2-20120614/4190_1 /TAXON_ID=2838 /ORGANISM="Odontella" /LENGTH=296 /DNA_ID=CAMNT_0000431661 /DNA_START=226 /DNA_END=1116 /DNA_ORIENTATION=- /assembly_acc=CAM_ASM_000160
MNRDSPIQESDALQILDDIDHIKSCDFSPDSFSDMLKSVEWQLTGTVESTRGRTISNDAVQSYVGWAVDDAVEEYLSPMDKQALPQIPQQPETAMAMYSNSDKPFDPSEEMIPQKPHKSPFPSETRRLQWLSTDSAKGPASPSSISGTQSVTPPPTDDEREDPSETMKLHILSQETRHLAQSKPPTQCASVPPRKKEIARPLSRSAAFKDEDVLLGRGGLTNHHLGNKRYREEVERLKPQYRQETSKKQKTEIRNRLVDIVRGYGGRFMKYSQKDGWEEAPIIQARKKASQALREK